jgi:hypothetical protein
VFSVQGFRVRILGFRVQGLEFRVQGSGFKGTNATTLPRALAFRA